MTTNGTVATNGAPALYKFHKGRVATDDIGANNIIRYKAELDPSPWRGR